MNIIISNNPGRIKPKTISVNGAVVGAIYRIEKTGTHIAHWSGEVTNQHNKVWRVTENTLQAVEDRVREAFKPSDER